MSELVQDIKPVSEPVLEVRDLTVSARARNRAATDIVQSISFSVRPGEVVALIGESGSGKTTISLACMGYARPGCRIDEGTITLNGIDILSLDIEQRRQIRGSSIAYVAQSAAASFNGALRLNRQVTETAVVTGRLSQSEADRRAVDLYEQLDLPNPHTIGDRYPHQVSGGQLQRAMIAMAMICDPDLLLLDEPTTALDVTTQIEVLNTFKRLIQRQRTAAIYVSHDLAVVAQVADTVVVLKDGRMVESGPIDQILNAPVDPYTQALIAAAHVMPEHIRQRDTTTAHNLDDNSNSGALLTIDNIDASYGRATAPLVLKSIHLDVFAGRTLGVIV